MHNKIGKCKLKNKKYTDNTHKPNRGQGQNKVEGMRLGGVENESGHKG
jgi:hypothetical protein